MVTIADQAEKLKDVPATKSATEGARTTQQKTVGVAARTQRRKEGADRAAISQATSGLAAAAAKEKLRRKKLKEAQEAEEVEVEEVEPKAKKKNE